MNKNRKIEKLVFGVFAIIGIIFFIQGIIAAVHAFSYSSKNAVEVKGVITDMVYDRTDPGLILQKGSEIRIYVDGNDYSKYYVDVQGALEGRIIDYT